jgi:predicted membrane chloride channel (bestrophin family)
MKRSLPRVATAASLADLAHSPTTLRPFASAHDDLFADGVATPDLWAHLRSWRRHLPDGTALLVCRGFGALLAAFVVDALLVTLYFSVGVPRWGWPAWHTIVVDRGGALPLLFNLTSFALSLLLVFRTNGATARWWEARCAWGSTVNAARNLGRLLGAWLGPADPAAARMAARWCEALPWCKKAHLGGTCRGGLADELASILTPEEIAWLTAAAHRPSAAAAVLEGLVARAARPAPGRPGPPPLPPEIAGRASGELCVYINAVGACERISRTAMPLSYTRSTSRFLTTWLFFLPLAIYPACGWATPAVEGIVAFLLLSIENVAVHYEQAVSNLPMAAYCASLAANVREDAAVAAGAGAVAAGLEGAGAGAPKPALASPKPPPPQPGLPPPQPPLMGSTGRTGSGGLGV